MLGCRVLQSLGFRVNTGDLVFRPYRVSGWGKRVESPRRPELALRSFELEHLPVFRV